MSPEKNTNIRWERLLKENPGQLSKAKLARDIVLNLNYRKQSLSGTEVSRLWELIESEVEDLESETGECEVVPLGPTAILDGLEMSKKPFFRYSQWLGVAAILVFAVLLSVGAAWVYQEEKPAPPVAELVYEEHVTPPGVKSSLTLNDGSKVLLNSGSSLRYVKNFESDKRVLYLSGEAYFEVAKDSLRPFTVVSEGVKTTALGTVFNVSAYDAEDLSVSLVEGKVAVAGEQDENTSEILEMGEELKVNLATGVSRKGHFDPELVLAWTNKRIVFRRVKMEEAIRVLENWYGVKFKLRNKPAPGLLIYGEYEDEILENVLEGLSYSARFEYKIRQDEVELTFK
ncbi:FecR domain-containing protein [Algoriphagus sp. H41]|uniref:FecR domain-containing protein n=1 Tax=Algoriphagus oliviformis TaxID=2811231 RepID=A0ABS3C742_9BACT|nr:FecR family protein [Algoriphagus oliviformis]MBN7812792.1 FecR domain-containing protein [Algoriphagus oliviformis]